MKTTARIFSIIFLSTMFLIQPAMAGKKSGGVINGKLAACPNSPNCVVSFKYENDHYVRPLGVNASTKEEAKHKLMKVLRTLKKTKVVRNEGDYIHVEFRTTIGFVDDVEFYVLDNHTIGVRSASRMGFTDFGKNEKRVESLRNRLAQIQ